MIPTRCWAEGTPNFEKVCEIRHQNGSRRSVDNCCQFDGNIVGVDSKIDAICKHSLEKRFVEQLGFSLVLHGFWKVEGRRF